MGGMGLVEEGNVAIGREIYMLEKKDKRSVNCENQWRKEECTVVVANEGHVDCLYFGECDCETLTV